MKVICIDDTDDVYGFHDIHPKVGEVCEVTKSGFAITRLKKRILCYQLKGYPPENGYNAEKFIPLSDIDETTLVNHKEETAQCQVAPR